MIGISQTGSAACDGPCFDQWDGVVVASVVVGCLVAAVFGTAWYRLTRPSFVDEARTTSTLVEKVAYRFVPLGDDGAVNDESQLVTITTQRLGIGSRIETELLGFTAWEVVEIRVGAEPFVSASDEDGRAIPFGGTVICRGVS
jgi:hypothetical protein